MTPMVRLSGHSDGGEIILRLITWTLPTSLAKLEKVSGLPIVDVQLPRGGGGLR